MTDGLCWCPTGIDRADIRTGDGHVLASYQWGRERNHPYFHPIQAFARPGVMTNHAPWDHPWHHGLWWSWKFVNDLLYWEDRPGYGGGEHDLGRSSVVSHTVSTTRNATIDVIEQLAWTPQTTDAVVLDERRTLTVRPSVEAIVGSWAIDWDLRFTAREHAHLSTTPYPEVPWGGYAGLNYRPARSLAAGERILGPDGRTGTDALHGQPSAWCAYLGRIDGVATADPVSPPMGGVAILGHPGNPGHPAPAYVFSAADAFGFLAAAPLMHDDLHLSAGEELRLRYRVLVLGANITHQDLDHAYGEYTADASVRPGRGT